ncbi:MAG TPA: hypothetical protein VF593_12855 [Chthoniobacteraceae bacterium]|jgi:hypothetical protein
MIATYGLFTLIGVLSFPLAILFGFFVVAAVSDIISAAWRSGIQLLDLQACLALSGVGVFLWDIFMLIQVWRFAFRRSTFFSPTVLWTFSVCSMSA